MELNNKEAKLILAAPDLLEAAIIARDRLLKLMDNPAWTTAPFGSVWDAFEKLEAAIKKTK